MKAVVLSEFGGVEKLALRELPDPVPGPGEVTVRVRAVGVNPVDTYIRTGAYGIRPPLPYTPGTDGAAIRSSSPSANQWERHGDADGEFGSPCGRRAMKSAPLFNVFPLLAKTRRRPEA